MRGSPRLLLRFWGVLLGFGTFIRVVPLLVTVVKGDLARILAGSAVASSPGRAGCIDAGSWGPGVSASLLVLVALILPFPPRFLSEPPFSERGD